jgi:DNA polymerase-3 subunit delta
VIAIHERPVGTRAGVARFREDGSTPAELISAADARTKGAPVEGLLMKEGGGWEMDTAAILKGTKNLPAAQRLISFAGSDGRALVNELGKLASYVGRGGRVGVDQVDLLVQDSQEQNLFAFIDELSTRRGDAALQSLRRLIEDGQAATYILFMIARQVRILLGVKDLAAQRMRPDDIAAKLGQKPFVVRKALDQARAFSDAELAWLHDRVLELDHATKTGRMEAEAGLEVLVVELCR